MSASKNRLFTFKQFNLTDEGCGMKIGTDGLLLGAWAARFASVLNPLRILDIGTGCGLVALMIAQKSSAFITAIDNDLGAYLAASENFEKSPWNKKLKIVYSSLQEYQNEDKELINLAVCNPPYFENSLLSTDAERNKARHNENLTFDELFYHSRRLMAENGNLIIIYPSAEQEKIRKLAQTHSFIELERLNIFAAPDFPVKRIISNFCKNPSELKKKKDEKKKQKLKEQYLTIENGKRNSFTKEYILLTRDYHPFLD